MILKQIAVFHSPFGEKFGVPRQSGLVPQLPGSIVFLPEFRNVDALRGIEGFDYLWLIWGFSLNETDSGGWSPTVRPPVLGGNERMGVWATRSPFRPNPLGLSSVRIEHIEWESAHGPVVHVCGADLVDGTPIYDIKPYIPFSDAHPQARGGFATPHVAERLVVSVPDDVAQLFGEADLQVLKEVLSCDPRPRYHDDPHRIYGMDFMGRNITFSVSENVLTVVGCHTKTFI